MNRTRNPRLTDVTERGFVIVPGLFNPAAVE